jgi:hypothetical protein
MCWRARLRSVCRSERNDWGSRSLVAFWSGMVQHLVICKLGWIRHSATHDPTARPHRTCHRLMRANPEEIHRVAATPARGGHATPANLAHRIAPTKFGVGALLHGLPALPDDDRMARPRTLRQRQSLVRIWRAHCAESVMPMNRSVLASITCALLLAACGDPPAPVQPPPAAPAPPSVADVPPVPPPPTASSAAPSTGENGRDVDSPATQPMAPLTKEKEVNSMPLAGQGNSHSSPSLDPTPGK